MLSGGRGRWHRTWIDVQEQRARRFWESLRRTPMRLYHGEADRIVPVERSREMLAALKEKGADATLETYASVGHQAWDAAFSRSDLAEWLVRQMREGGG